MKTKNTISTLLIAVGLLTTSVAFGQSCDTLRNYTVPSDGYYTVHPGTASGYALGQTELSGGTDTYITDIWLEPYNLGTSSSEIRAIRMLPYKIEDNSGTATLTLQVYNEIAGEPGNVIGSQVVPYSDIYGEMYWEVIELDAPITVTGKFYVGYKLSTTSPIDYFALAGTTPTSTNYTMFHLSGSGPLAGQWMEYSDVFTDENNIPQNSAFALDLLLSTDPVPVSSFTLGNDAACLSGVFENFDVSSSSGTIDTYQWWLMPSDASSVYDDQYGANATLQPTTSSPSDQIVVLWTYGACVSDLSVQNVTVNPDVSATVLSTIDDFCGTGNGGFTISGNGGDGTYLYSIDGGVNTQPSGSFTNLLAGAYSYEVTTEGNGCSVTGSVSIGNAPAPTIDNITITDPTCGDDNGIITVTASGGTGTLSYSINGSTAQSNNVFENLPEGSYTIEIEDDNGCVEMNTITLTNDGIPEDPTFTVNDFCEGSTNTATILGVMGGTFTIVAPTGGSASIDAITGEITNALPGSYTIQYQTSGTCPASETQNINVYPIPTYTPITTDPSCGSSNGEIELTTGGGSGPYTYSIDNGANSQNGSVFTNLVAGNYPVLITDANGCEATGSVILNNLTGPTIDDVSVIDPTCNGNDGVIEVTASGGSQPLGYSLNGVGGGNIFSNLSEGTYTVEVEDASGCTTTENVVLVAPTAPTVDAGTYSTACVDDTALGLTGTPAGGTFTGTGVTGNNFNPSTAGIGTFTITYDYTDPNGCQGLATTDITVDGCLGLTENTSNLVTIAPNPASEYIQVTIDGNNSIQDVQIISLEGQAVNIGVTKIDNHSTQVNVSSIARGVYFIQITTERGEIVKKIVVQ